MPFCRECGSRLEESSKFCTECGERVAPVQDNSAVTSHSPSQDGKSIEDVSAPEKVVSIIPNLMWVRGLGLFLKGPVWHHLVVTPQRFILVRRTVQGIDRIKQDIGIIGPDYEYPLLKYMQPDKILEEYPESIVIPLQDLISIEVTRYGTQDSEEGIQYYRQVRLATKDREITLRTDYGEDPGEYFRDPVLIRLLKERLILEDR